MLQPSDGSWVAAHMCLQQQAPGRYGGRSSAGQLRACMITGAGPAIGDLGHAPAARRATTEVLRGRLAGAFKILH